MIDIVADLHLHSKYSRAVSPQMTPPVMAAYGKQKGIDVLATGDWTHPLWLREIKSYLEEAEEGLYKVKDQGSRIKDEDQKEVRFLLSVEIASIYTHAGKGRRIHNLVFAPSFSSAEKINQELLKRGYNLSSDGRPILGLSSRNLLELILGIDERSMLIPAHVWTPWFGIYGQMSGFDSLSDAFGDLADKVYGIETGLSSDPEMNWQVDELNTRSILSFSDAHSPAKMGREATVFRLKELSYENIRAAIMQPSLSSRLSVVSSQKEVNQLSVSQSDQLKTDKPDSENRKQKTENKVLYTIEFYPEEGKYHYSGHRNCGVTMTPEEQRASGGICPVCNKKVTDGVMRRVQEIATGKDTAKHQPNQSGLVWIKDEKGKHPPFVKIVPLQEIIAESIGAPFASPKTKVIFDNLTLSLADEFTLLLKTPLEEISKIAGPKVAEGIQKVRKAQIVIKPGYDGVFGVVKIWNEEDKDKGSAIKDKEGNTTEQVGLEF